MTDDNLTHLPTRMSVATTHDLISLMERHCRLTKPLIEDAPINDHFEEMMGHMMSPLVQLLIAPEREHILNNFSEYGDVASFFAECALYVLHNLREQDRLL